MGTPSPRCTVELKRKAVELYGKSGTTCAEVVRGLGCDAGSLSDWAMKADAARPAFAAIAVAFARISAPLVLKHRYSCAACGSRARVR